MNVKPEIDVTRDHWTNRRGDYWRADRTTLTVEFWNSPVRGWQASKIPIDVISWMMEMGYLDEVERDLPEPPKPSPLAGLVSPMGFHPAMMGPIKGVTVACNDNVAMFSSMGKEWSLGAHGGGKWIYALRKGSEIARLNGLEPEAIPADKEPEPELAKRREWTMHRHELNDFARISDVLEFPHSKRIRVREVLPGDPTIEQVAELVEQAAAVCDRLESQGWAPNHLRKALQPFTAKP